MNCVLTPLVTALTVNFLIISFRPANLVRTTTLRPLERARLREEEAARAYWGEGSDGWGDEDEEESEAEVSTLSETPTPSFHDLAHHRPAAYLRTLTVAALIHNHRSRLREWIEFYSLMGVEHFLIYDHGSTDLPLEILNPYIEAGNVTYITWPPAQNPRRTNSGSELQQWKEMWLHESLEACRAGDWPVHPQKPCQYAAFSDAIERTTGRVSRWLGVLEIEDFVFPRMTSHYSSLRDLLGREHSAHDVVVVQGSIFGTNGHLEHTVQRPLDSPLPPLITESYQQREDHACQPNLSRDRANSSGRKTSWCSLTDTF